MRGEQRHDDRADTSVVIRSIDVPIRNLAPALSGLRLVHVTDLHFRRWNRVARDAQALLEGLDYDILVVTGDFGASKKRWRTAADITRRFFEPIAERGPAYAVLGNHDHPNLASADTSLRFLNNESVLIKRGDAVLELMGVDQSSPDSEDLEAALCDVRPNSLRVLLAHYPSTVFRLPPRRVDIQLSGHTHGGQIRLPLAGCLWAHDTIPNRLARGLHAVEGILLHVSPGIGVSPPVPIRLNCPPEISVLTLRSADPKVAEPRPEMADAPDAADDARIV